MLSTDETRQLDRLALAAPAAAVPDGGGARLARARGLGLEFHDFRRYHPGDDPRAVEWSIFARLGQLVLRTSRADALLRVHVLVDSSASMAVGTPGKLSCAQKIAALLTYVAIRERDAVGVAAFDDRVRVSVRAAAGRAQLFRVLSALDAVAAGGASAIGRALTDYAQVTPGPGLVVIVSDFLDPMGIEAGLHDLMQRGLTPALLQVLAPEDVNPSVDDEIDLVDAEGGASQPITVTPASVRAYLDRLNASVAHLAEFCASRGLPWMQVQSSASFGDLLEACRHAGLLAERI